MISYFSWQMLLIYVNAVCGIAMLEHKLNQVRRHFDGRYDALNERFPGFKRIDAQKWSRWKLYPGAMTILLPRIIFMVFCVLVTWAGVSLLQIGQSRD